MQNATIQPMNIDYLTVDGYAPESLLDALIARQNLKNDAALSRVLMVAPPVISKIRSRSMPITNSMLIRMHDVMQLSISELRKMMGVQA